MSLQHYVSRRTLIVVGVIVLAMVGAAAAGGCYVHRRPPDVSPEQRRMLQEAPLPYTVAIVPWNVDPGEKGGRDPDAYAQTVAKLVANSRAFKASRFEKQPGADVDLVIMSTGAHCNASVVPVFSIITAGLIPTVFTDEDCDGMVIRSAKASNTQPLEVAVSHKSEIVMGWGALIIGALPNWSYGPARNDARYGELLRLEILRNREGLAKLATDERVPIAEKK